MDYRQQTSKVTGLDWTGLDWTGDGRSKGSKSPVKGAVVQA